MGENKTKLYYGFIAIFSFTRTYIGERILGTCLFYYNSGFLIDFIEIKELILGISINDVAQWREGRGSSKRRCEEMRGRKKVLYFEQRRHYFSTPIDVIVSYEMVRKSNVHTDFFVYDYW